LNQVLLGFDVVAFLLLPVLVLSIRFRAGSRFPWPGVFVAIAVGGWLLGNASIYFYRTCLCEGVRGAPLGTTLARCDQVRDARQFIFDFGWGLALLYSFPYFGAFFVASWLRTRRLVR
jgi:hypothetical protein